jgi:hypothetical protein
LAKHAHTTRRALFAAPAVAVLSPTATVTASQAGADEELYALSFRFEELAARRDRVIAVEQSRLAIAKARFEADERRRAPDFLEVLRRYEDEAGVYEPDADTGSLDAQMEAIASRIAQLEPSTLRGLRGRMVVARHWNPAPADLDTPELANLWRDLERFCG